MTAVNLICVFFAPVGCAFQYSQMAVVSDTEGPASSVTARDDGVMVATVLNGTVDAIKLELELLPAVGEVMPHIVGSRY